MASVHRRDGHTKAKVAAGIKAATHAVAGEAHQRGVVGDTKVGTHTHAAMGEAQFPPSKEIPQT
jgi:hypothetical protein